ncbi:hypothetical protein Mgra_00003200, partial [Meloidogyne graminicola]
MVKHRMFLNKSYHRNYFENNGDRTKASTSSNTPIAPKKRMSTLLNIQLISITKTIDG